MAKDFENEREELSNGEREREGPKKSVCRSMRNRVMMTESERDRVMTRNNGRE